MSVGDPGSDRQVAILEATPLHSGPSLFFAAIRGRSLIGMFLLAFVAPVIGAGLLWPQWYMVDVAPIPDAVIMLLSYGLLVALLWIACRKVEEADRPRFITWPCRRRICAYTLLGIPLIAIAILGVYVLYLPLSYIFPDFVVWWVLEETPFVWWSRDPETLLATGINAITVVAIGPVVEEFFFRGFLLNRWWRKYGVHKAVIFSSIAFALLHVDFIGGLVFGIVLALIYIRTNSLIGPIIAHVANNGIALLWEILDIAINGELSPTTLDEFRSEWWMALLGAAVSVPWLIWFCKNLLRREPLKP